MTKKKHYLDPDQNFDFAKNEEEILKFWQENKIFEQSIKNRQIDDEEIEDDDNTSPAGCCVQGDCQNHQNPSEKNEFVFYDGPPFANGLPHYGHLLTGYIKDIFARYQTMKGKKVERKFGWDTHGLPVEMEVEKDLGVSGQIAIKEFGIKKFNDECKKSVMKYANQWQDYVNRQGRWVDFENGYKTMDVNYMESVLWAFKELYKKGLMYEDLRVVPYSWACQTPLSNFETRMDNAYRRKESKAISVAFELEIIPEFIKSDSFFKYFNSKNEIKSVRLIAWTTTPWTLPSNLALAINQNYQNLTLIHKDQIIYIVGVNYYISNKVHFFDKNGFDSEYIDKNGSKGSGMVNPKDLIGLKYQPLFPYLKNHKKVKNTPNCFTILHGDFVSTEEGTGIVHIAPGFGEDDQAICKANDIPTICPVDEGGKFNEEIFDLEYEE